jgi:hypothetical protein
LQQQGRASCDGKVATALHLGSRFRMLKKASLVERHSE